MFCPKCGTQNPETGKFCRSCGTDLGTVSDALSGKLKLKGDKKNSVGWDGEKVSWEGALTKFFIGAAFLVVSIVLAFTGKGSGSWFWMLIPAFAMIGSGIAQYVQLKKIERRQDFSLNPQPAQNTVSAAHGNSALPPTQTEYVAPESRYKTGDLVPPSVAETTTRHLEINKEGKTMTLPKK